jgi:hypothetical protein
MLFCYLILRLLSFCGSCGGQCDDHDGGRLSLRMGLKPPKPAPGTITRWGWAMVESSVGGEESKQR